MKSYDYDAMAYDGAVYCTEHLPDGVTTEDAYPVFADSEWDHYPTCDHCHVVHDYVNLTDHGMVLARVRQITDAVGVDEDTAMLGYAAWSQDHHHGQRSLEYRVPTILGVKFGPMFNGRPSLSEDEVMAYDWLCDEDGCDHGDDDADDPTCAATTASECAMMRERAVAGLSNDIPPCPIHGEFSEVR